MQDKIERNTVLLRLGTTDNYSATLGIGDKSLVFSFEKLLQKHQYKLIINNDNKCIDCYLYQDLIGYSKLGAIYILDNGKTLDFNSIYRFCHRSDIVAVKEYVQMIIFKIYQVFYTEFKWKTPTEKDITTPIDDVFINKNKAILVVPSLNKVRRELGQKIPDKSNHIGAVDTPLRCVSICSFKDSCKKKTSQEGMNSCTLINSKLYDNGPECHECRDINNCLIVYRENERLKCNGFERGFPRPRGASDLDSRY